MTMASIFEGIFFKRPTGDTPGTGGEVGGKDAEVVGQNSAIVAGNEGVGATVATAVEDVNNKENNPTENQLPKSMAITPSEKNGGWNIDESSILSDSSDTNPKMARPTPKTKKKTRNNANAVTPTTPDTPDRKRPAISNATPRKKGRSAEQKAKAKENVKERQPPIKPGMRVKCRRSQIYHCLPVNLQQYLPTTDPNYHNYFGTVVKKAKAGNNPAYDIRLDVFPNPEDVAKLIRRNCFRTLKKDEDEPPIDPRYLKWLEADQEANDVAIKDEEEVTNEKDFVQQPKSVLLTAKTYTQSFSAKKDPIVWDILEPDQDISNCSKFGEILDDAEDGPELNKGLNFDEITSHGEFFLKHMWPDMTGLARRIDEYHANVQSPFYSTVKDRRISIHDANNQDHDWKVKQVILLIVKSCTVPGTGVEQFFKSGYLPGSNEAVLYPDYGRFFDINEFKVVVNALPFMWCDKALWYRERRDVPWDIFIPFIDGWNKKQQELFTSFRHTIMDESMIGWVPKGSKLGGLPNYVYEKRKPVPLGTMLKDSAEAATGIIIQTDPIMTPTVQGQKLFANKASHSPDKGAVFEPHAAHTAEVLRQVYNSGLHDGCWTGGDTWFGSIQTCLALKLEEVTYVVDGKETRRPLNVESSWVMKNNTRLFPRGPLYAALRARYPTRMTGHWVVFKTVIKGVNLIAIAYAWSNKDVAYMVSTIGNTNAGPQNYICFDTNTGYDKNDTKQYPRPHIVDFLFRQLPIIDSYNSLRQHTLAIEKQFPTKCPWTKLLNAYIGQTVVNQQKLFSYRYPGIEGKDISVIDMAATIAGAAVERKRKNIASTTTTECRRSKDGSCC